MTVRGDLNTGNPGTEIWNPVELRGQTGRFPAPDAPLGVTKRAA